MYVRTRIRIYGFVRNKISMVKSKKEVRKEEEEVEKN